MRRRTLIAWLAVLSLVAASCANGDTGEGDTTTTGADTSPTTAEDTSPTTAEDSTDSADAEPVTVRYLQPSPSMAYLPFELADAAGFFEEEGIDVELLPHNPQGSQALLSGEVDIASVSTPQLFNAIAEGRPLKSVAVLTPNSSNDVVLTTAAVERLEEEQGVTPDSPVEDRIAALQGLRITLPQEGSSSNASMRSMLREYGLDPDTDVELIPLGDATAHVTTAREDQSDGYWFSPPVTSVAIAEGFGVLWLAFYRGDVPLLDGIDLIQLAATDEYIDENPETIEAFIRAIWRAIDLLDNDPDQAATVLKDEWFPDLDQETYDVAFDSMRQVFLDGLEPTEEDFERTKALIESQVERELPVTFEDIFVTELVQQARP